jgi:hypothetical protein
LENSIEDFRVTVERTGMAAKWDETAISDWLEEGRIVYGSVLEEAAATIERAEAREAKEARVRLMETNQDELFEINGRIDSQAEEAEPELLIEFEEEIDYRRDNVTGMAKLLKGKVREEFGERAQRALDESVEAAKKGKQRLNVIRARLDFHSGDSEAGSYVARGATRRQEVALGDLPPVGGTGPQREAAPARVGQAEGAQGSNSQAGAADLATLLRGWGQLRANDSGWPVFDGKYVDYPRFKREWKAYRETYHSIVNDVLVAKTLRERCVKGDAGKMVNHLEDLKEMWDTLDTCYKKAREVRGGSTETHPGIQEVQSVRQ